MSNEVPVPDPEPKPLEAWILLGAGGFGAAYHNKEDAVLAADHGCVERIVHMREVKE